MKVKTLINELSKFNPNANVGISIAEDIAISYITEDEKTKYNKTNTPQEQYDISKEIMKLDEEESKLQKELNQ